MAKDNTQRFLSRLNDPLQLALLKEEWKETTVEKMRSKYHVSHYTLTEHLGPKISKRQPPSMEEILEVYENLGNMSQVARQLRVSTSLISLRLKAHRNGIINPPINTSTIKKPIPKHIIHQYDYSDTKKYWELVQSIGPIKWIKFQTTP